jgi:hypothetical protein
MTHRYVRSTDGNNADTGLTWALAKADLAGMSAGESAGDSIWVSQNHAAVYSGVTTSLVWSGGVTTPLRIQCADDTTGEPPTTAATGASESISGNGTLNLYSSAGQYLNYEGIAFNGGDGTGTNTVVTNGHVKFKNCNFSIRGGAASALNFSTVSEHLLRDCGIKFANAGHSLAASTNDVVTIRGGSLLAGTTSPTNLWATGTSNCRITMDGFDMSNAGAAMNIFNATGASVLAVLRDCKLPSGWSGALNAATPGIGSLYQMFNCDDGSTNYRYRSAHLAGTVQDEETIKKSSGASDKTTAFSYKMVSNANCIAPVNLLESPELVQWNDTTGASKTATVEIVHDSLTNLTDAEIWLELMYMGDTASPLATIGDDGTDAPTAAADQAASAVTWTTTGLTNPNKQKLSVTFTPQKKGPVVGKVVMTKASKTVYIDPVMTIA